MSGLLVRGREVQVPGVWMSNRNDDSTLSLDGGDFKRRVSGWIRLLVIHTTKGKWPQRIAPGLGPARRGKRVADFWRGDPQHSAAHIVIGSDGIGVCLADVVLDNAYHASNRYVNDRSIGIEIYQEADGSIYEAAIDAAVKTCRALVEIDDPSVAIQWQHQRTYRNAPLQRLVAGGSDVVGIVGHRDVTHHRGIGDPGELIWAALAKAGSEAIDFDTSEDRELWRDRQIALQEKGHRVTVDGVAGPSTRKALRMAGYRAGVYALGRGL